MNWTAVMYKIAVAIVKECLESIMRWTNKLISFKLLKNDEIKIIKDLKKYGLHIEKGFLPKHRCDELISIIDKLILSESANVWRDETDSDKRIYFVNEIDSHMTEFYENKKIRAILNGYTGSNNPVGMLLAARIDHKTNNQGSGGGWHRDSPYTHQFKAVCYLSDVDEDNGPFQYIKKSHSKYIILKNYINKIFTPGQYRFTNEEIERYLRFSNQEVQTVCGSQGTIVYTDTKGIHRGKPLASGSRYVLFCYFWNNKIPEHFAKLKQDVEK